MPKPPATEAPDGDLAGLLVRCRTEKNLRLEDVSRATGLSTMTISNVERRRKKLRRSTRYRIEQFLRKQRYLRRRIA